MIIVQSNIFPNSNSIPNTFIIKTGKCFSNLRQLIKIKSNAYITMCQTQQTRRIRALYELFLGEKNRLQVFRTISKRKNPKNLKSGGGFRLVTYPEKPLRKKTRQSHAANSQRDLASPNPSAPQFSSLKRDFPRIPFAVALKQKNFDRDRKKHKQLLVREATSVKVRVNKAKRCAALTNILRVFVTRIIFSRLTATLWHAEAR